MTERDLEQSMKIDIKLDVFEGPLDLLLHLIEKNKVSIYDIPIVEITNQYMEYIREMEKTYSMESMSEFLVMAATLLKIKSKMLLPQPEKEEEEDPREELVRRLTEYKMYEEPIRPEEIVGDITLEKLNQIFRMVMRRKKDREDPVRSHFGKIQKEKYKVEDRMDDIRRQIRGLKKINFRTLLDIQPVKEMVIVTFLAVLELMKVGEIKVNQEHNFAEIYLDSCE